MRGGGGRTVGPVIPSGSASDEVTGTEQKVGGGMLKNLISTGMQATVKDAAEDVLSARIEDLAGAGVAQRDSTVLRVGTALGASHQPTAVEKVVPRGMHACGREGARSLTHMEAPNASEGCRGAAHLDGDVPQARENLQRDLRGGAAWGRWEEHHPQQPATPPGHAREIWRFHGSSSPCT